MIDTVKFKIALCTKTYKNIITKISSALIYKYGKIIDQSTSKFRQIRVGEFKSIVTIIISDPNFIYVEGSLPKILYGENLHLLYPSQLGKVLNILYEALTTQYGEFPSIQSWLIHRIDFCYCWKYDDPEKAKEILTLIKFLEYPRKSYHRYLSSVMYAGKSSSIKFYLKEPEIIKTDVPKLYDIGLSKLAQQVKQESQGTLRFEIELRKSQLLTLLRRDYATFTDFLSESFIFSYMNRVITTLRGKVADQYINDQEFFSSLSEIHDKKVALALFAFYHCYFCEDLMVRQIIRDNYSKYAIRSMLSTISKSTVNFPPQKSKFFDLSIPSPYVINDDPYSPADAGE